MSAIMIAAASSARGGQLPQTPATTRSAWTSSWKNTPYGEVPGRYSLARRSRRSGRTVMPRPPRSPDPPAGYGAVLSRGTPVSDR
jgi:hypothetical protein